MNVETIQVSSCRGAFDRETRRVYLMEWLEHVRPDVMINDYNKKQLPAIMPHGVFYSRRQDTIQLHSGLVQVDIDGKHQGAGFDPENLARDMEAAPEADAATRVENSLDRRFRGSLIAVPVRARCSLDARRTGSRRSFYGLEPGVPRRRRRPRLPPLQDNITLCFFTPLPRVAWRRRDAYGMLLTFLISNKDLLLTFLISNLKVINHAFQVHGQLGKGKGGFIDLF